MKGLRLIVMATTGVLAFAVMVPPALADDRQEYVAEFEAYHQLSAQTRLLLKTSATDVESSDSLKFEGDAYLDITLMGSFRERLRLADWARSRDIWVRIGYLQLRAWDGRFEDVSERRGVLQATVHGGSWQDIHVTHRLGFDYRDLNGKESQRYRYRLNIEREFKVRETAVIPYLQAELFYDTRYSAWSKQGFQLGSEIDLTKNWRIEPYLARDKDTQPSVVYTDRLGVVVKFYW